MKTQKISVLLIALIFGFILLGTPNYSTLADDPTVIIVTNPADSGPGTLRQAILDAVPGDWISFEYYFTDSINYTIYLESPLTIDKDLQIYGPPVYLSGSGNVGLIVISPGATVTLSGVRLYDGSSDYGGAIANYGSLYLFGAFFRNDHATYGGAIYNEGLLWGVSGGGIFAENSAQYGGAIYNKGTVDLWDSSIAENSASIEGGGVYNDSTGNLYLHRINIAFNHATRGAGIGNSGQLGIANITIAFNVAEQAGGGIFDTGSGTIANVTVASNSAPSGAGIYSEGATTTLVNTIVANSDGTNCAGNITDGGYNLSWPVDTCPGIHADPKLINRDIFSPYWVTENWYVPVELAPDSPAINAGNDAICAGNLVGSQDQYAQPRPQGAHCDIGAFESPNINEPPVIISITAPFDPVPLGDSIDATIVFSVPDTGDTHTVLWDWGDTTSTLSPAVAPSLTTAHTYLSPGVYSITATITDATGLSASATFQYMVVYDPDGGFVTGGGWINSPAGAYTADPTLIGKATFGFVSKYQKGAAVPTGNTEFQFNVGNLKFKSIEYDWLVIAGSKAQYKGTGTINGAGNYGFMLTATDGTPDKLRIKIWDKTTSTIIYDNQIGMAETADPVTMIEGGSIVIHK